MRRIDSIVRQLPSRIARLIGFGAETPEEPQDWFDECCDDTLRDLDEELQTIRQESLGLIVIYEEAGDQGSLGAVEQVGIAAANIEASINANALRSRTMSLKLGLVFDRTRQEITEFSPPPFRGGPKSLFYIREGEVMGAMYGDLFITELSQLPSGIDQSQFQVNDEGYVVWVGSGNAYTDGISKALWETKSPAMATPCGEVSYTWGFPIKFVNESGPQACLNFAQIGNVLPDYNLGFHATFRYKGLTAYMLWNAQIGGDIYNGTAQSAFQNDRHRDQDQAGKPDALKKTATYMQQFFNANGNNNYYVEDGTYLKLREVSLEYSVNRAQLSKWFGNTLHRVSVGVSGRNLLTFTGYSGFDPETGKAFSENAVGGDASLFRVDNFNYPNFRTFTGRLTIEF